MSQQLETVFFDVITDVKAIIAQTIQANPDEAYAAAALGGTSIALIECAYQMGMDKEELKQRIQGDIDEIYKRGMPPELQKGLQ
jgi:hypothetical protein